MKPCSTPDIEQILKANIEKIRTELGTRQPKVVIKKFNILMWKLLVQEMNKTFPDPWVDCGQYFTELLKKASAEEREELADPAMSNFVTMIPADDVCRLLQSKEDLWSVHGNNLFNSSHVMFAVTFWESARQMAQYDQLACMVRFRLSAETVKTLSSCSTSDVQQFVMNTISIQKFRLRTEARNYEGLVKCPWNKSDEKTLRHPELARTVEIIRASIKACQNTTEFRIPQKATLMEIINFRKEIEAHKSESALSEETQKKIASWLFMSGAEVKSVHPLTGLPISRVRYLYRQVGKTANDLTDILSPLNPPLFDSQLYRLSPDILKTGDKSEVRIFKNLARAIWSLYITLYLHLRSAASRYEDDINVILTAWENLLDVIFDTGVHRSKFFCWHFVSLGTAINVSAQIDHREYFEMAAEKKKNAVTVQVETCEDCKMKFLALQNQTETHTCCPFCSLTKFVQSGDQTAKVRHED